MLRRIFALASFIAFAAVAVPTAFAAAAAPSSAPAEPLACTSMGGSCASNSDCCSNQCDYSNGHKVCW